MDKINKKNKINKIDNKEILFDNFKELFNIKQDYSILELIKRFESGNYSNNTFEIQWDSLLNNIEIFIENIEKNSNSKYNIKINNVKDNSEYSGYFNTYWKFIFNKLSNENKNKIDSKLMEKEIKIMDKIIDKIIINKENFSNLEDLLIDYADIEISNISNDKVDINIGFHMFNIKKIKWSILLYKKNELIKTY